MKFSNLVVFSRLSQYLNLPVICLYFTFGSKTKEIILTAKNPSATQYSMMLTRLLGDLISAIAILLLFYIITIVSYLLFFVLQHVLEFGQFLLLFCFDALCFIS